jgi:hypothetical protein
VNDRVPGLSAYKVPGGINFRHELQPNDFQISDSVFRAFKEYLAGNAVFKSLSPLVDHNRSFIALQLRFNLVTAAYGRAMADRVFITTDEQQVAKAIDVLPRARELAMSATKRVVQP